MHVFENLCRVSTYDLNKKDSLQAWHLILECHHLLPIIQLSIFHVPVVFIKPYYDKGWHCIKHWYFITKVSNRLNMIFYWKKKPNVVLTAYIVLVNVGLNMFIVHTWMEILLVLQNAWYDYLVGEDRVVNNCMLAPWW